MADADTKEKKAAPKRELKYAKDAKITLLADKDGKVYGPDNNPKNNGSKAAARFAIYKNGMTVQDFVDAGGTRADIDNDVKKKFISVK